MEKSEKIGHRYVNLKNNDNDNNYNKKNYKEKIRS